MQIHYPFDILKAWLLQHTFSHSTVAQKTDDGSVFLLAHLNCCKSRTHATCKCVHAKHIVSCWQLHKRNIIIYYSQSSRASCHWAMETALVKSRVFFLFLSLPPIYIETTVFFVHIEAKIILQWLSRLQQWHKQFMMHLKSAPTIVHTFHMYVLLYANSIGKYKSAFEKGFHL